MNDVVVVIRTKSDNDILAIIRADLEDTVKVECPYYVRVSQSSSNVIMMPYCPLSDERFFEIKKDHIEFLVTANPEITNKFLKMVESYDLLEEAKSMASDKDLKEVEDTFVSSYVSDTKH